jgi:hypothetical protein
MDSWYEPVDASQSNSLRFAAETNTTDLDMVLKMIYEGIIYLGDLTFDGIGFDPANPTKRGGMPLVDAAAKISYSVVLRSNTTSIDIATEQWDQQKQVIDSHLEKLVFKQIIIPRLLARSKDDAAENKRLKTHELGLGATQCQWALEQQGISATVSYHETPNGALVQTVYTLAQSRNRPPAQQEFRQEPRSEPRRFASHQPSYEGHRGCQREPPRHFYFL